MDWTWDGKGDFRKSKRRCMKLGKSEENIVVYNKREGRKVNGKKTV